MHVCSYTTDNPVHERYPCYEKSTSATKLAFTAVEDRYVIRNYSELFSFCTLGIVLAIVTVRPSFSLAAQVLGAGQPQVSKAGEVLNANLQGVCE